MATRVINGVEARALTREQRWELLSPYLLQDGRGCLAYSTLQNDLDYFIVEGKGYIASKTVGKIHPTTIVLGDPICDGYVLRDVLDEFLKIHPDPVFAQISRSTKAELAGRGFFVNHCGIETWIDLQTWDLTTRSKRNLRTSLNKAANEGVDIVEFSYTQVSPKEGQDISAEWLRSKTNRGEEMSFLTRPAVYDDEPFVRRFCARDGHGLLGFIIFDPVFEQGAPVGYLAGTLRTRRGSPRGLLSAIQCSALERFKAEGLKTVSLGWSPLYRIEDAEDNNSPFTTILLTAIFQLGQKLYSFRGLALSKRQFCGEEKHVYMATRHKYPLVQLYRCFGACNINPLHQLFSAALPKSRTREQTP
jgi:lysylphosphatidylglycerol synthetase-like protein (DUF2156 family)